MCSYAFILVLDIRFLTIQVKSSINFISCIHVHMQKKHTTLHLIKILHFVLVGEIRIVLLLEASVPWIPKIFSPLTRQKSGRPQTNNLPDIPRSEASKKPLVLVLRLDRKRGPRMKRF